MHINKNMSTRYCQHRDVDDVNVLYLYGMRIYYFFDKINFSSSDNFPINGVNIVLLELS